MTGDTNPTEQLSLQQRQQMTLESEKAAKEELHTQISAVEDAMTRMAGIPGMDPNIARMKAQQDEMKVKLYGKMPVGVGIAGCRKNITTGGTRLEMAQQAHALTGHAVTDAQIFIISKEAGLVVLLEEELKERSSGQATPSNSLEAMSETMSGIISEMRVGGVVPGDRINETMQHMDALFTGLVTRSNTALASPALSIASTTDVNQPSVMHMLQHTVHQPMPPVHPPPPQQPIVLHMLGAIRAPPQPPHAAPLAAAPVADGMAVDIPVDATQSIRSSVGGN